MSDEVSNFLRSVEALKGMREEEDEARSRELEEKILQEKRARQARRAERARSISPQKSSPANTPPPASALRLPTSSTQLFEEPGSSSESPAVLETSSESPRPRSWQADIDTMGGYSRFSGSTSPTKENESPFDTDLKRASFSSRGQSAALSPLSWQRRSNSQVSERSKSRPLSVVAAENAAVRSSPNPVDATSPPEQTIERNQIAQQLLGMDPAWSRQTADRGLDSVAYRKNQPEDQDAMDVNENRTRLPGLSIDPSPELSSTSHSTSRPESPATLGRLGSPLLGSAPRLEPPCAIRSEDEEQTDQEKGPSSPVRMSPRRPGSPTKGMGGFVQSAFMKRTDSVKRWSVTSPTGLQRADSYLPSRNSGEVSPRYLETNSRPNSMQPKSRPISSHSRDFGTQSSVLEYVEASKEKAKKETQKKMGTRIDEGDKTTPPTSPFKTMDHRRWSPTKSSSWLEAALNKPESPRPRTTPAPAHQPAWMVELNKAKAQKASSNSVDLDRAAATGRKHEVKTGGLMRPPPMGAAVKYPGLAAVPGAVRGEMAAVGGLRNNLIKPAVKALDESDSSGGGERRGSAGDLASLSKVKPDTPPKPDFRANLKARTATPQSAETDPKDELKSVFGTLRKTKTQNYVAPDLFKGNIMRGKAALNVTGGPKKTERKDEFKEAILKKKEDFKKVQEEGRRITRTSSNASETQLPEGLVKKLEMARTGPQPRREMVGLDVALDKFLVDKRSSSGSFTSKRDSGDVSPKTAPKPISNTEKKSPVISPSLLQTEDKSPLTSPDLPPAEKKSPLTSPTLSQQSSTSNARASGKLTAGLAGRFNPALADVLARGPPSVGAGSTDATDGSAKGSPQLTHLTKNRARGPKRKAPTSVAKASEETEKAVSYSQISNAAPGSKRKLSPLSPVFERKPSPGFPLSESPKGPRPAPGHKPLPSSQVDRRGATVEDEFEATPRSFFSPSLLQKAIQPVESPERRSEDQQAQSTLASPTKESGEASTTRTTRPRSPTKVHEQVAALAARAEHGSKTAEAKDKSISQPSSPKKLDMKRVSQFFDQPDPRSPKHLDQDKERLPSPTKPRPLTDPFKPSATKVASSPPIVQGQLSPEPVRTNVAKAHGSSPTTQGWHLPDPSAFFSQPQANGDKVTDGDDASLQPDGSGPPGAAFNLPNPILSSGAPPEDAPSSHLESAKAPPLKGVRPLPAPLELSTTHPDRTPSPMRSPTRYGLEVSAMLTEFFGPGRPKRNYSVDAEEVWARKPVATPKVKTEKMQLFQVLGDGKKMSVPAHNERVLFECEMYLCFHTFVGEKGQRVGEVYFWSGDEVSGSVVQEAQLFVEREAKISGDKLIKLWQGKETSEFLQALGGFIIVRRGSSNKYDSLARSMLCGRRYLGQVVFDEVDFTSANLCSGFPYVISQNAQCYLWRGKGSDVAEVGCARLVGAELALMSELVEIEEGNEPAEFWSMLDGGTKPQSADHWRLKPKYDKYRSRLYLSDPSSPQQVIEISPFIQSDLLPSNIYILDAFFEIYIIVGARSQHQYAAFHNALDFAGQYAIVAAGAEDRPFVPVSTVVLEGTPRDLRSVFRKWTEGHGPTIVNVNGPASPPSLKRGRSLRIVPLNQALQALTG